jgi:hypothetical protein
MRRLVLAAALAIAALSPRSAQATPCEEFTARLLDGAAYYKVPAPKFELVHVNEADANIRYWSITMFGDVRAMMSCWHGSVGTFAADANDNSGMATVHLSLLMGLGLYGYEFDLREAAGLRDQLMREARAAEPQIAKLSVDGGEASLIISFAGVPSFQIDVRRGQ